MEWKLVVLKVVIHWSVLSLIPPNYLVLFLLIRIFCPLNIQQFLIEQGTVKEKTWTKWMWTYPSNKILLIQIWIVAGEIKALKQAEILSHRTTSLGQERWNHALAALDLETWDWYFNWSPPIFPCLGSFARGNCGLIPRLRNAARKSLES